MSGLPFCKRSCPWLQPTLYLQPGRMYCCRMSAGRLASCAACGSRYARMSVTSGMPATAMTPRASGVANACSTQMCHAAIGYKQVKMSTSLVQPCAWRLRIFMEAPATAQRQMTGAGKTLSAHLLDAILCRLLALPVQRGQVAPLHNARTLLQRGLSHIRCSSTSYSVQLARPCQASRGASDGLRQMLCQKALLARIVRQI